MNRFTWEGWPRQRFGLLILANVLVWMAFAWSQPSDAQQRDPKGQFISSASQRKEIIQELKEIKAELKAQNALLSSGQMKVVVVAP